MVVVVVVVEWYCCLIAINVGGEYSLRQTLMTPSTQKHGPANPVFAVIDWLLGATRVSSDQQVASVKYIFPN